MVATEQSRDFERALLSHADTCYAVAVALTKDPVLARKLAEETLIRAWAERDVPHPTDGLKMELLSSLRANYLKKYKRMQREAEATPKAANGNGYYIFPAFQVVCPQRHVEN